MLVLVLRGRSIPERGFLLNRPLPKVPQRQPIWFLPVVAAAGVAWYALMPGDWADPMTASLIGAVVFLSFVVIVAMSGTSLVQMGFAGVGALVVAKVAAAAGLPFPVPILAGAAAAVPLGLLVGLPALRVRGLNLAVITLGAAFTLDQTLFSDPTLTGMDTGLVVPAPRLFGIPLNSVTNARAFGIFVLAVFLLAALLVTLVRRSSVGMRFLAIRANEHGAAAAGISVIGIKLAAFSLAGAIAGVAGGPMAYRDLNVSFAGFDGSRVHHVSVPGVFLGGITSVGGALTAGVLLVSGGVASHLFGTGAFSTTWIPVLSGLGTMLIVVTQPEGMAGPTWPSSGRRGGARGMDEPESRRTPACRHRNVGGGRRGCRHHPSGARRAWHQGPGERRRPGEPGMSSRTAAGLHAGTTQSQARLDITGLSVSFGGVQAVVGVDLSVGTGELVGLIGPGARAVVDMPQNCTGKSACATKNR